jgi:hypothetical protein
VNQYAMLVLGNMASEHVDSNCINTKERIYQCRTLLSVVPHLWSDQYDSVLYALGVLINTCEDARYVNEFEASNLLARLEELLVSGDDTLAQFAQVCIDKIRRATHRRDAEAAAATKVQAHERGRAARRLRRKLVDERLHNKLPGAISKVVHARRLQLSDDFMASAANRLLRQSMKSTRRPEAPPRRLAPRPQYRPRSPLPSSSLPLTHHTPFRPSRNLRASRSSGTIAVELAPLLDRRDCSLELEPLRFSASTPNLSAARQPGAELSGRPMLSNTALPPVRPRATDKDAALANTARVFGGPFVVRRVRVPRRADRRQPLSVELPQPVEPGRLLGAQSLRTDERGYLMLPEVRVPGSFGLPRRPHASFPTLRIDDPTSEHALHQDLEHARLWEARVHAGEAFYGLRWEFAGLERPHFGAELFCDELARSLSLQKLIFTRKEFEVFGLRELRPDHFIRTDAGFFRPTGVGTRGSALRGAARQLDAATLKSCSEQLNKLVAGASAKLLDVFRDWDLDHNGRIDMKGSRPAMELRTRASAANVPCLILRLSRIAPSAQVAWV